MLTSCFPVALGLIAVWHPFLLAGSTELILIKDLPATQFALAKTVFAAEDERVYIPFALVADLLFVEVTFVLVAEGSGFCLIVQIDFDDLGLIGLRLFFLNFRGGFYIETIQRTELELSALHIGAHYSLELCALPKNELPALHELLLLWWHAIRPAHSPLLRSWWQVADQLGVQNSVLRALRLIVFQGGEGQYGPFGKGRLFGLVEVQPLRVVVEDSFAIVVGSLRCLIMKFLLAGQLLSRNCNIGRRNQFLSEIPAKVFVERLSLGLGVDHAVLADLGRLRRGDSFADVLCGEQVKLLVCPHQNHDKFQLNLVGFYHLHSLILIDIDFGKQFADHDLKTLAIDLARQLLYRLGVLPEQVCAGEEDEVFEKREAARVAEKGIQILCRPHVSNLLLQFLVDLSEPAAVCLLARELLQCLFCQLDQFPALSTRSEKVEESQSEGEEFGVVGGGEESSVSGFDAVLFDDGGEFCYQGKRLNRQKRHKQIYIKQSYKIRTIYIQARLRTGPRARRLGSTDVDTESEQSQCSRRWSGRGTLASLRKEELRVKCFLRAFGQESNSILLRMSFTDY